MKRSIKILLIISVYFLLPLGIHALDYPVLDSKILEIYDLTDKKVIKEIDSNKQTSIASLTKIVTTITAIDNITNLDEQVTITNAILNTVRWDASKAGLRAGDVLTYRDLLYASMLPSGADATNSIAILSSGSIDNFVSKMNDLVAKLELKSTHFVNVTGLDIEGHYSTADEIRKILEYSLKNELFRQIYTTREYTLSNGLTVYSTITTYNKTGLVDTSKILGSKTGYTGEAGYCLSSLSNINSHEFIIIVLNAEHKNNIYYNIVDTTTLINFLEENFKEQLLINKGKVIKIIPIKLSKTENYKIKTKKNITKYLPSDYDKEKIKVEYTGLEELSYKNKKNEKIGEVSYYYDNELITSDTILLNKKIEVSIKKVTIRYHYQFIILLAIPVLLIIVAKKWKKKKKRKNKK